MLEKIILLGKICAAFGLVALAISQVYRPEFSRARGATIRQIRLPIAARLRLHGQWLVGVAGLFAVSATPQVVIGAVPLAIVGTGMGVLVAIPVRYTIRQDGIQVGRTPVRRWTEFAGLSARNGRIYLKPVSGSSGLVVRSPGGRDGEVLLTELRGLFRLSYKGESGRSEESEPVLLPEAGIEVSAA